MVLRSLFLIEGFRQFVSQRCPLSSWDCSVFKGAGAC